MFCVQNLIFISTHELFYFLRTRLSTVQCSTVQYSTVQYSNVQYKNNNSILFRHFGGQGKTFTRLKFKFLIFTSLQPLIFQIRTFEFEVNICSFSSQDVFYTSPQKYAYYDESLSVWVDKLSIQIKKIRRKICNQSFKKNLALSKLPVC